MPASLQRAIVVDHVPFVRLGLARVLETEDVDVVAEFGDARPALAALDVEAIDLVVLGDFDDMRMESVVKQLRKHTPTPSIIALLSIGDSNEVNELIHLGTDALLLRNAAGKDLAEALRRVRGGERLVTPSLVPMTVGQMETAEQDDIPPERGGLTRKELAVLRLLAAGKSNKEIADEMFVTGATVKTHLAHIYSKLEVKDRHQAIARALALGLLS